MEEELIGIKNSALSLILDAKTLEELEEIRIQFLGRSGKLTELLKNLPRIPLEKRVEVGTLANEVKRSIEEAVEDQKSKFKNQKLNLVRQKIDVTNPSIKPPLGHLHPITQAISEISEIFERIGFRRMRYPEVEWDYYAFSALNFPDNHPARDDWETFFVNSFLHPQKGDMLLTPHTSSGQVREMERTVAESERSSLANKAKTSVDGHKALIRPIRMLNIAKCYRRQSDVSHTPMFHQFETLVIDKDISIAHLKGVLDYFAKAYFGKERKTRIRQYHFQFTEPSFEVDVTCGVCKGRGCRLCKQGWLEMGGAGMVHPNVLKMSGIDPEKYTGFASGWGVERVLMMKEGIEVDDLRLLYSNRLEFLEQF